MYLLDTNTVSNYLSKNRLSPHLRTRLTAEPKENIWISIVTVEEISKGALEYLNVACKHPRNATRILQAYAEWDLIFRHLMAFQILPYDQSAEDQFMLIPPDLRRRDVKDRYIAAIALSRGLTVVTSNTRHFVEVPGVTCVDWMLEANQ